MRQALEIKERSWKSGRGPHLTLPLPSGAHLRRSFTASKEGYRAEHDPSLQVESVGIFAAAKMAHLSDDKAVAKMGYPF